MKKLHLLVLLIVNFLSTTKILGQFTPGNLVIYRVGDGSTVLSNTGNVVYLDEYTTSGVFVSTLALPNSVIGNNQPLYASGTATSEGLMTLSQDGRYLAFVGYGLPNGSNISATGNSTVNRVAGLVDYRKNINTSIFFKSNSEFASGSNPRGAASINGTQLWLTGGISELRYINGTAGTGTASTSLSISNTINNYRGININYDNITAQYQLYISTKSTAGIGIGSVGSGEPTTSGQIVTNLSGTPTGTEDPLQLVHLTVSNIPVLYYMDNNIGGVAGSFIYKYVYNITTNNWDAKGSINIARNGIGLTAKVIGNNVNLYATATNSSNVSPGGVLYNITDVAASTSVLSGTAVPLASPVFTFANNKTFRGIAFAPLATEISLVKPDDQAFCNDGSIKKITFNSSPNTTVNWTIINSSISGLGLQSGNGTISFLATSAGNATVIASAYYGDKSSMPDTFNINVTDNGTWTGSALTTDWNNNSNWCGGIPSSLTNVIIPVVANGFYPNLKTTTQGYVNDITINNGASITVGNNSSLHIHGAINNNGIFDVTNGTIEMAGSLNQNIGGSMFLTKTIKNLIDSNISLSGVTVTDTLNITNVLGFDYPSASITTNNVLVLVSNAAVTASVGRIAEIGGVAQATINGNVIIQRYFVNHRRWRFITAPIQQSSGQTINAAWQEGGVSITNVSNPDPYPGFGTHITGPAAGAYQADKGFDQSPTNSPSIAIINTLSSWTAVPNTNATKVTDHQGYMLFVRGARDYDISNTTQYVQARNTTLRTTGKLNTGSQTIPTNNGTTVIGNPYASIINFSGIYNRNAASFKNSNFYLWDPNIASNDNLSTNGTGGWITINYNSINETYLAVPDPIKGAIGVPVHSFDINGDIQSGSAFLINGTGVPVTIDEEDKVVNTTTNYLFRPVDDNTVAMLRTTLYATTTDSTHQPTYLADGVLNMFSPNFNNAINGNEDVQKQSNLNERCAIIKDGEMLSIQKSLPAKVGDSILLYVKGLKKSSYRFDFVASKFNRKDIAAFLIDSSTKIATPINLSDSTTIINFTVTDDSTTFAENRFYILFKAVYDSTTTIILPQPQQKTTSNISIYPNPIQNNEINLQFNNMTIGLYNIKISNVVGQTTSTTTINHTTTTEKQTINLGKGIAKGTYILEVFHPDKSVTKCMFIDE